MIRRLCTGLLAVGAVVVTGACSDGTLPTSTPASTELALQMHASHEDAVCEAISFDDQNPGLTHGQVITSLAGPFGFDLSVTVSETTGPFATTDATIYDTNTIGGPDPDLEWQGTDAECLTSVNGGHPDCQGQGNVLIIRDSRGFASEGDAEDSGGRITFTGFTGNGTFFLKSFKAVDDDLGEPSFTARVGGVTEVGTSTPLGNGTVETVTTTQTEFTDQFSIEYEASGAVDDVMVCQLQENGGGDEGCTPGYWRQPHHFDSWPEEWTDAQGLPAVGFCDVFTCSGMIPLRRPESGYLNNVSLLDALSLRGGGVNALARHAAAAALNANGGSGVDFAYSLSEVQSMVNTALAESEYDSVKDDLEEANEAGCPLN